VKATFDFKIINEYIPISSSYRIVKGNTKSFVLKGSVTANTVYQHIIKTISINTIYTQRYLDDRFNNENIVGNTRFNNSYKKVTKEFTLYFNSGAFVVDALFTSKLDSSHKFFNVSPLLVANVFYNNKLDTYQILMDEDFKQSTVLVNLMTKWFRLPLPIIFVKRRLLIDLINCREVNTRLLALSNTYTSKTIQEWLIEIEQQETAMSFIY